MTVAAFFDLKFSAFSGSFNADANGVLLENIRWKIGKHDCCALVAQAMISSAARTLFITGMAASRITGRVSAALRDGQRPYDRQRS